MGLDVDSVVAKQYIDKLKEIVFNLPHGEREEICDDIIEFVTQMQEKYNNK